MNPIKTKQDLINYINQGNKPKYLCFWGHQPNHDGSIGKSCFSQWYEALFQLDGVEYQTAEHYMMAEKARLFKDDDALAKILAASHPGEAKKLGRQVKGFKQEIWLEYRSPIVVQGNIGKFSQNEALKEFLLNTGERILVEASPRDRIWGIGLGQNNPDAENPYKWQGLNLLGFALMEVRNIVNSQHNLEI
ncbi:MAG: NADAR family protein [Pleurocapsa sp. MO_192.B19]|nr:NADAR family protein [Pleurocapsa sp. MO_192.B19]